MMIFIYSLELLILDCMIGSFIVVDILTIIAFVTIKYFLNVESHVPNNRLSRIIGRMMIFKCSLELVIMVLVQYGLLPLSASSIGLLLVLHFCTPLIAAIMSSLLIYNFCCSSSSEEYEIGDYEDTEMCDDKDNPEHEVHYYYDLVAVNNDGTMDREQQQHM